MEILLKGICYILGYIVGGIIFLAWAFHDEYKEMKHEERFFSEREEQIEQAKKYFLSRAVNKEE